MNNIKKHHTYADFLMHRNGHKYISKHKSKAGKWVYVYNKPGLNEHPEYEGYTYDEKTGKYINDKGGAVSAEYLKETASNSQKNDYTPEQVRNTQTPSSNNTREFTYDKDSGKTVPVSNKEKAPEKESRKYNAFEKALGFDKKDAYTEANDRLRKTTSMHKDYVKTEKWYGDKVSRSYSHRKMDERYLKNLDARNNARKEYDKTPVAALERHAEYVQKGLDWLYKNTIGRIAG